MAMYLYSGKHIYPQHFDERGLVFIFHIHIRVFYVLDFSQFVYIVYIYAKVILCEILLKIFIPSVH